MVIADALLQNFVGTGTEAGSSFEREEGFKWISKSSPCDCEYFFWSGGIELKEKRIGWMNVYK